MKRVLKIAVASACAYLVGVPSVTADQCADILAQGIWNHLDARDVESSQLAIANWACSNSSQSGGGGFGFGPISVDISKADASNACSSNSAGSSSLRDFGLKLKTLAPQIATEWGKCMDRYGSYAWIEFLDNPLNFNLELQAHEVRNNIDSAKILYKGDFACLSDLKSIKVEGHASVSCWRNSAQSAVIMDVIFDKGTRQSLYIPAFRQHPAEQPKQWKQFYIEATAHPDFQMQIENFVNSRRPRLEDLGAAISGGKDFYIWAANDGDGPNYKLKFLLGAGNWNNTIEELFGSRKVVIVGFNNAVHNGIWYLEANLEK